MAISLIDQRRIEAAVLGEVYADLRRDMSQEEALARITRIQSQSSIKAGRAFAERAPNGTPSLAHFSTVTEIWQGTGALALRDVRLEGNTLSITVARCGYVEMYREMGLPKELVATISCCRDEPFAKAYSPRISMHRPETIGGGFDACGFLFTWE